MFDVLMIPNGEHKEAIPRYGNWAGLNLKEMIKNTQILIFFAKFK